MPTKKARTSVASKKATSPVKKGGKKGKKVAKK
jgi:hypothetical protein